MMPEEWPIAAPAAEESLPAPPAPRGRLATVRADFFLDPAKRLTEQERALMTAMLHSLVGDVANALRAALPNGRLAANDGDDAALIGSLTTAGLLDEPGLMAALLRRADEERIATAARARSGRREARVLQGLVSQDHGAIASAAMALILARGRRRDRFGQCVLAFDDLSPASAYALVQAIAAGTRNELAGSGGSAAADRELAAGSQQLLEKRDTDRGIDALTAALVQLLDEAGSLTDELVLAAALEGEIAFIAAVLARRAGIALTVALDELLAGDPDQSMVLFRSAGASRELVAGLLAGIGDLLGISDPGEAISLFESLTDADVAASRSWLETAPAYRAALERLGQDRG
jgi:hypothetical protein